MVASSKQKYEPFMVYDSAIWWRHDRKTNRNSKMLEFLNKLN